MPLSAPARTRRPEIDAILAADAADVAAAGISQKPSFFVNGKPLTAFGAQELYDLVRSEMGDG